MRAAKRADARKAARRATEEARRPAEETAPPPAWLRPALLGAASVVVLGLALLPSGPLAYLPRVLSWPLAAAAVIGWWVHDARGRGLLPVPERLPGDLLEGVGLALILSSYFLLKLVGLHPSGTDDNIYFYMANRITQGAWPYRDFFFAHPPVHLLVPAAVFSMTGFSIGVAKAIPAVAQCLAGVFLYLALRRTSRTLALVALLLHLTAYEVLMGSTDMNGENIMTAFLMASLLAATRGRFVASGALAGLALGSGLYALAGVLAVAAGCLSVSRRALARFGAGFGGSVGLWLVVFAVIGGHAFWEGVFLYHLAKPVGGSDRIPIFASGNPFAMAGALSHNLAAWLRDPIFKKSLYFHAPTYILVAAAAALPAGAAVSAAVAPRPGRRWWTPLSPRGMLGPGADGLAKLGLLAFALFMLQWAALNEVYDFYMVPMIVFAAIPGAFALVRAWEGVRDATRWRALLIPAAIAGAFCLNHPWADSLSRALWGDEGGSGDVVNYRWREPWALASLSGPTRELFFEESRMKGEVTPYYRHFVWNKMLTFSTVAEIADTIRANSAPDETIMGASTLAPLVALYADRRLAGDEADTNNKRFSSGMLTDDELFDRACSDNVRYIVSASRSHFDDAAMAKNPVVKRCFVKERDFLDPDLVHFHDFPIHLWRRSDVPGLPEGKVCAP